MSGCCSEVIKMAGIDTVTLALAKNYADEHDGRAMDAETKAAIVEDVINALPDGDGEEY